MLRPAGALHFGAWILVVVLGVLADLRPVHAAPKEMSRGPAPSWIAPAVALTVPDKVDDGSHGGVADLVIDDQIRVAKVVEHYVRRVRRIVTQTGVERLGELELSVDPSYERVVVHRIDVVRHGQRIDATKAATLRVLDAEDEREARIYNGTRNVVFLLADLRVGDVIDLEATYVGVNPVFGAHVARTITLGGARRIEHRRARLVLPTARAFALRTKNTAIAPVTTTEGDQTVVTWSQDDVPAVPDDGDEPSWFEGAPAIAFSDWKSWGEVAAWAMPLYETWEKPQGELAAKIAAIAREHAGKEERALAALRFVQNDVRYLGIELGESSHRPHSPASVFAQRFGDCKDKVVLFLAMLRELGIEASPAFVDTDRHEHVVEDLPSPTSFDHVVARVELGDRAVWVDPTRSHERGPLGAPPLQFRRALVVAYNTSELALVSAEPPEHPTTVIRERFAVSGGTAKLLVETTYSADDATGMRRRLAGDREKLAEQYLEHYAKVYPRIESSAPLAFEDDPAKNVVVVREAYSIAEPIEKGQLAIVAYGVRGYLGAPKKTHRSTPLAIDHPLFVRHEIEVTGVALESPGDETIDAASLAFSRRAKVDERTGALSLVFELRSSRDHVPASGVDAHLSTLKDMRGAADLDLSLESAAGRRKRTHSEDDALLIMVGAILGVGLLAVAVIVGVSRGRAVGRAFAWRMRRVEWSGETPAKAVRVATRDEAESRAHATKPRCGHVRSDGDLVWGSLSFDGATLLSAKTDCTTCGETETRYFRVAEGGSTTAPVE